MNWKDFLYFPKGDRIAIILLLLIICISGSVYIYLSDIAGVGSDYATQTEEMRKSFVEFEEGMQDIATDETRSGENAMQLSPKANSRKNKKLAVGQTLDVNSASLADLTQVPGIGDTLAGRIIQYRDQLGGFVSLEQLQEIKGITVNKFSHILPYLVLKTRHNLIRINHLTEEELSRHPYLSGKQSRQIVLLRQKAKIQSPGVLAHNEYFTARDIERLTDYISFD